MPLIQTVAFQGILGATLERFRSKTALDQAAMAKNMGMSAANLSRLENGHGNLSVEQLFIACQILDVSPSYFIYMVDETKRAMEAEDMKVGFWRAAAENREGHGYIQIARKVLRDFSDRVTALHARLDPDHQKKYGDQTV